MFLKNEIINRIIDIEGGYVNNPDDSGGPTMWGITQAEARSNGYNSDMKYLPRTTAFEIYSKKYWDSVRADDILMLSEKVAEEIVDTSINMGPNRAITFLQRSLNVLNKKSTLYEDLTVDGKIGPITIDMLYRYLVKREEDVLVKMLNCLQGAFYVELAERREKDETFVYGWFVNRVVL